MNLDLDVSKFLNALKSTVKEISSLSKGVVDNKSRLDNHNKSLQKSEKEWKKYAKAVGMSKAQVKSLQGVLAESNSKLQNTIKANSAYSKSLAEANNRIKQLETSVKTLTKSVDKLEKAKKSGARGNKIYSMSLQDIARHAQRLIRYYVLMKVAILLLGEAMKTISEGAQFEKSLLTLQGVTRTTSKEISVTEKKIRELGSSTEWTANQVAEASRFLGMAGLSLKEINIALAGVTSLATAGNIGLAQSADIATNIMTAFGLKVTDLGRVNDVLIGTITRTNSSIEEMSEALKYAAPVGKAFGYEIEEVASMLGMLHNAGIKGSMAGTNIARAMFKAGDALKTLKPYISEDQFKEIVAGGTKLIDVLAVMKGRGFDAADMIKMFGDRGAKAALILQDLNADTRGLNTALEGARGETEALAEKMRTSLIAQFDLFKSAVSDVRLDIFTEQAPKAASAIKELTKWVQENKKALIETANALVRILVVLKDFLTVLTYIAGAVGSLVLFRKAVLLLVVAFNTFSVAAIRARIAAFSFMSVLGNHPIIKGILLAAAAATALITVIKSLTSQQEESIKSNEKLAESIDKVTTAQEKKIAAFNKKVNEQEEGRSGIRNSIYAEFNKEMMTEYDPEKRTKAYHAMLVKLKDQFVINKAEMKDLNKLEKERSKLMSITEKSFTTFRDKIKKLEVEYNKLNEKANTYYLAQIKLVQLRQTKEEFYSRASKMYEGIYNATGSDDARKSAIENYKLVLGNKLLLDKITLSEKEQLLDAFITKMYKKEISSYKRANAEKEKLEKKHIKDLQNIRNLLVASGKDSGGQLGEFSRSLENMQLQKTLKEQLLTIDREIESINSDIIAMDEADLEIAHDKLDVLKQMKRFLVQKAKDDRSMTPEEAAIEADVDDLIDEQNKAIEADEKRIELMEEYNQQLKMAAANIAAMAIEGASFDDIMKSALTALGTYAGQAVGTAYGGPAGGAIGGVIGGAIGGALGDMLGGDSGPSEIDLINKKFKELRASMDEFDKSIKLQLSTPEQISASYKGYLRNLTNIKQDMYDGDSLSSLKNYINNKKRINSLLEAMEPLRQKLIQLGASAELSARDIEKSRDKYYKDKFRENWSTSDLKGKFGTDNRAAGKAQAEVDSLKAYLKTLTKGSDRYKRVEADLALAQIANTEALNEKWESEQKLIESMETMNSSFQSLKDSLSDLRTALLEGEMNPDQSFAWAQEHYDTLKGSAQAPGASADDVKAYQNYIQTYLSKAKRQYGSTDKYSEIFDSVVNTDIPETQDALTTAMEEATMAIDKLRIWMQTQNQTAYDAEIARLAKIQADQDAADQLAAAAKAKSDAETAAEIKEYWKKLREGINVNGPSGTGDSGTGPGTDGPSPGDGWADGGISYGPTSGYPATLHGVEAIIPLQNGSVPVSMSGTTIVSQQVVDLLNELVYVTREGQYISVEVDGGKLDSRIRKQADLNRVDADNQGMKNKRMIY